jgi:hypothetical protein
LKQVKIKWIKVIVNDFLEIWVSTQIHIKKTPEHT